MALPLVSESGKKWLDIVNDFPKVLDDVCLDAVVVFLGWVGKFSKDMPDGLGRLGSKCNHASDLTHFLAIPGRVTKVLSADSAFKFARAGLDLTRSTVSVAKFIFDDKIIDSPSGQHVAAKLKYSMWIMSGSFTLSDKLMAIYKPSEDDQIHGRVIQVLDVIKGIVFILLGSLRLLNHVALKPYILPTATLLLTLASVVFIAKRVKKNLAVENCP